MLSLRSIVVSSLGAVAVTAINVFGSVGMRDLVERQDQSFQPISNTGFGNTCADAFGAGYIQCGTGDKCYSPGNGESCCSNTYPCPTDSFCLINGYCCPDGIDPATCAINNGVSLPPDFSTAAPPPPANPPASTPSTPTTPATPSIPASSSYSASTSSYVSTSIPSYTPSYTSSNYTYLPTGSVTGSSTLSVFTGAADMLDVAGQVLFGAALLGAVGNLV